MSISEAGVHELPSRDLTHPFRQVSEVDKNQSFESKGEMNSTRARLLTNHAGSLDAASGAGALDSSAIRAGASALKTNAAAARLGVVLGVDAV